MSDIKLSKYAQEWVDEVRKNPELVAEIRAYVESKEYDRDEYHVVLEGRVRVLEMQVEASTKGFMELSKQLTQYEAVVEAAREYLDLFDEIATEEKAGRNAMRGFYNKRDSKETKLREALTALDSITGDNKEGE